eukprot:COSAG06_NODE_32729_length_501_cov_0.940299_1_plen_43_part_10
MIVFSIKSTTPTRCRAILQSASFYQDRLGTDVGKEHSKREMMR